MTIYQKLIGTSRSLRQMRRPFTITQRKVMGYYRVISAIQTTKWELDFSSLNTSQLLTAEKVQKNSPAQA